ncbi:uncharacterized protein LOC113300021 [Papaver somniferum]|uniref:uncharacterized protein LOC113300021 n=1 Tax=Papaver somniferum TaxID=3469 RepID=UPI000E704872|nr:uncharacterized protein LOC113300021 [Papaver somniferum]
MEITQLVQDYKEFLNFFGDYLFYQEQSNSCGNVSSILPTRDTLVGVIQDDNFSCPFCTQQIETASHIILECPLSKIVWFAVMGLHIVQGSMLSDWICGWFDKVINKQIQESDLCKIGIIAWCIWNSRYDRVFKDVSLTPESIIQRCRREFAVLDHRPSTNYRLLAPHNRNNIYWQPPLHEFFKINSDGSFISANSTGGIGLICRDFAGAHHGSKCIYLSSATSPEQAESKALWEAMKWAMEKNLKKVIFELDTKLVVDAMLGDALNIDWRLHNLILDIKNVLKLHISWQCSYVPKEKNKVADSLSKLARTQLISGVWI